VVICVLIAAAYRIFLWLFLLFLYFCFLSTSQEISWEEHLRNYLFCVEWDWVERKSFNWMNYRFTASLTLNLFKSVGIYWSYEQECGHFLTRIGCVVVLSCRVWAWAVASCSVVECVCVVLGWWHWGAVVKRLWDRAVSPRPGDTEGGSLLHRRCSRLQRRKSQLVLCCQWWLFNSLITSYTIG